MLNPDGLGALKNKLPCEMLIVTPDTRVYLLYLNDAIQKDNQLSSMNEKCSDLGFNLPINAGLMNAHEYQEQMLGGSVRGENAGP